MTALEDPPLEVEVLSPADVPEEVWHAEFTSRHLCLQPSRLAGLLRTPRWQHHLVLARSGDQVLGMLPVSRPSSAEFATPAFDPATRAPGLLPGDRAAADYLLIGGHFDLASGAGVRAGHQPARAAEVRRRLAATAFDHARAAGLTGVALFVPDAERAEWDGPDGRYACEQATEFATLEVPAPSWADYLASLKHSRRSVVVRDQRALALAGLHATAVPAGEVLGEAAALVADVQANHGAGEHPDLIEYRLDRWARAGAGTAVAFVLRERSGALVAASFGRRCTPVIEMYEIGLRAGIEQRGLAYAEVLVYAPLRHGFENGCTELRLGCESPHPKQLRGARISPVWTLALPLDTAPGATADPAAQPARRAVR